MNAAREQIMPCGTGVDVAALVHEDLEARIVSGKAKYGERLTTLNGRDALLDLYQELLDAVVYLRQVIWERDNLGIGNFTEHDFYELVDELKYERSYGKSTSI